jgi:transcriptional regulator with XRE-family HTH domain
MAKQVRFNKKQIRVIGQRIRAARLRRDMTQLELARLAFGTEVSHCHVSRLERAVQPLVSLQVRIEAVAQALNIRPSRLMAA